MEALSWYNFNPKGMIIFPYDINKLSCLHLWEIIIPNYSTLEKAVANYNTFGEIIIPKHHFV